MPTNTKKKDKFVITKQGKFATAGGGLGSQPRVYESAAAAQHAINTNVQLKGGIVKPYEGTDVAPGVNTTTKATPATATTSKTKATAAKNAKATKPKKASVGK